ncbi:hypothetical protein BTVI_86644 [Pitangus sulphuratus]|nr:hypothetical protein BTVI_86644 [Pitangus sulphuratus]
MSSQNLSQLSGESGEVPADLKLANFVLTFKEEDPGKYRPVSITSVPSKIMEKIILGSTEKYLEHNAVIGHSQHSFMRGKTHLSNLRGLIRILSLPTTLNWEELLIPLRAKRPCRETLTY